MATFEKKIREAASRNLELLSILHETYNAAAELEEAHIVIGDIESDIVSTDKKIQHLDRKRRTELKDHEKYRDSHIRRFFFKATGNKSKFAADAEKEEQEYFKVLEQQHQTSLKKDKLKQQLREARLKRNQLEVAEKLHERTQCELNELYGSVFDGPTPECPEEDEAEEKYKETKRVFQEEEKKRDEVVRISSLAKVGLMRAKEALSFLDKARECSRANIAGGGINMVEMVEGYLEKSRTAHDKAQDYGQRAELHILPEVNITHVATSDMIFDPVNVMQFHNEIKRAQKEMDVLRAAFDIYVVVSEENWTKAEKVLTEAKIKMDMSGHELQTTRQKMFERFG